MRVIQEKGADDAAPSYCSCQFISLVLPVVVPDVVAILLHAGIAVIAATVVEVGIGAEGVHATTIEDVSVSCHADHCGHWLNIVLHRLRPTPNPSRNGGERLRLRGFIGSFCYELIFYYFFLPAGPLHHGRGAHRAGWVFT